MKMKMLEDLHYKLCKELEEIAEKNKLSAGDIEIVHTLTDTLKNIDKIKYLEGEESGYSQRGGRGNGGSSYGGGNGGYSGNSGGGNESYRGSSYYEGDGMRMDDGYDDGRSGARRGEHYVRGHYSRGSDAEHVADEVREMMNRANDGEIRRALEKAIRAIEE